MAKLRNRTDQTLETRLGPLRFTTEPDDILTVDDDLYSAYVWPDTIWDDVEVPSGVDEKPHRARKSTPSKEND